MFKRKTKNEKLKGIIFSVLLIVVAISIFTPFVYWVGHPELTEMEMFLKYWWSYLIGILSYILANHIINK